MENCLFCKILRGEIPSAKVYEDEHVYAFEDIDKKAPFHVLVIPKTHVSSVLEAAGKDIIEPCFQAIKKITEDAGVDKTGFRVVANTGEDGGQTVGHLHFHVLAKRQLQWPPG